MSRIGSQSRFRAFVVFASRVLLLGLTVLAGVISARPAESAVRADVNPSHAGIDLGPMALDRAGLRVGTALADIAPSIAAEGTRETCTNIGDAPWGLRIPPRPDEVDGSQLSRSDMQTVTDTSGTNTGYLHPDVAPFFQAMIDAYAIDLQTEGTQLSFVSTYRSYQTQLKAYENFIATGSNLSGREVPNISHPDRSLHPKGYAIDFADIEQDRSSIQYQWLAGNAHRFGFRGISSEPWHWEFDSDLLQATGTRVFGACPLAPEPEDEVPHGFGLYLTS